MTCPCCDSTECQVIESIKTLDVAAAYGRETARTAELIAKHVSDGTMPAAFEMVRCDLCQLVFANPMFAAEAEWYAIQEKYGDRWEFHECLRKWEGRKLNVLEIGCGEGHFLELAQKAGHKIRGIDFNADAVAVARKKGVDAQVADLCAIESGAPPDAIVFFHVIEHLNNPFSFFADLAARSKSGAAICFSCPSPRRYTTKLLPGQRLGESDFFDYPPLHQTRWCQRAANAILSRTGWQFESYQEEPFHRIGVPGYVAARKVEFKGENFSAMNPLSRRAKILYEVARLLPASFRYSGMAMLVSGRRKNIAQ